MRVSLVTICCAASIAFAATAAHAATPAVSPDAVLANTGNYDGQTVAITGVVRNVQTRTMRFGTVVSYDLCAAQCVHVFDRSGATVNEGATITATGVFHAQLQRRFGGAGMSENADTGANAGTGWQARGGAQGDFPRQNVLIVGPPGHS